MDGASPKGFRVPKVIKTSADYEAALAEIERLLDLDPDTGTQEAERLELLSLLVEDYEERTVPRERVNPIEAIRFRMDQLGLSQKDLVPYFGTRSKVSEVLGGKRPLTLSMIRALHAGLEIPASVLLAEHDVDILDESDKLDYRRFPLREMLQRGWLQSEAKDVKDAAEEAIRDFFAPLGKPQLLAAFCRRTRHLRTSRRMDHYALTAWLARVSIRAMKNRPVGEYVPGSVTAEFMRDVARLSWSEQGPLLAREFLGKHGISLIVESHLPRTHLDGAAILLDAGWPAIGMTIRHDRLDNFWFCLMHELAHISLHLVEADRAQWQDFVDDLETDPGDDPRELEADMAASEALIPAEAWAASPASRLRTPEAAEHLASRLGIHPAIVAGRIRHESGSYRVLVGSLGQHQVRRLFDDVAWR